MVILESTHFTPFGPEHLDITSQWFVQLVVFGLDHEGLCEFGFCVYKVAMYTHEPDSVLFVFLEVSDYLFYPDAEWPFNDTHYSFGPFLVFMYNFAFKGENFVGALVVFVDDMAWFVGDHDAYIFWLFGCIFWVEADP